MEQTPQTKDQISIENQLNLIGGEWTSSATAIPVEDPASLQEITQVFLADEKDAENALIAAKACNDKSLLSRIPPKKRSEILFQIADYLKRNIERGSRLLCLENGKSISSARTEFETAIRYFEYYAGLADKIEGKTIPLGESYLDYTTYVPYGVSLQIVPWNSPVALCARSLAPALATGNSVIIKSPEQTPLAISIIGEACINSELPPGAVNILCGYGNDLGNYLLNSSKINQIVFTGSVETGKKVLHAAAEKILPTVVELGGKSIAVVFPDADIEKTANSILVGAFAESGQACSALTWLVIHRSCYKDLICLLKKKLANITIGPGIEGNDITPLISSEQLEKVASICRDAEEKGARITSGGNSLSNNLKGNFFRPRIVENVDQKMRLFYEEVFGPVLIVSEFETIDETIELVNSSKYGLVSGIYTNDINIAISLANNFNTGQVFINDWYIGGVETPFGGVKESGFGREKGQEGLYNYVQTKNIGARIFCRNLPDR